VKPVYAETCDCDAGVMLAETQRRRFAIGEERVAMRVFASLDDEVRRGELTHFVVHVGRRHLIGVNDT
jgi:hypothetical protein